jgi:cytochrome b
MFFISILGAFGFSEFTDKDTALFYTHVVFGVLAGLLLVWRIIWGFIGSKHVRWSKMFFSPTTIINYFREVISARGVYHAGHNPGGAPVIIVILVLATATVVTGAFITSAEFFEDMHETLPIILMVLVGVHVLGVIFATKMNKENYLLSMITGYKKASEAQGIKSSHFVAALIMLVLVLTPWIYFIKGFDRESSLFKAPGTQWTWQIGDAESKTEDRD